MFKTEQGSNFFELEQEVTKGVAYQYGNMLRQVLLNTSSTWTVIAFSIHNDINLLNSSDDIFEDMTKVYSSLKSLDYELPSTSSDFVDISKTFTHEFRAKDIETDEIKVIGDKNKLIVSSVTDTQKSIRLIFYRNSGVISRNENREILEEHHIGAEQFFTMDTVHSPIKNCTFTVKEGIKKDKLILKCETFSDAKTCIEQAIRKILSDLKNIYNAMKMS